ncbi:MAG TPA: TlpA disulfide reductase family protein [Chthoniobacterales bacterium]|nr:TlpA disulfide reductase family protein [Chthoniobacterales bacterium]
MKAAIALLLLAGFALFSIKVKNQLNTKESPLTSVKLGQAMPDFSLPDTNGQMVKFSDVSRQNRMVLITFWASWCTPCRMEMPELEKLYASKKAEGFSVLAINVDKQREKADSYLRSRPAAFPVLIDRDSSVFKQLGAEALPTTILVGQDGKVLQVLVGVDPYLQFTVENYLRQQKQHEP